MSAGGSASASDSKFTRKGTTSSTSFRKFLPEERATMNSAISSSQPYASEEAQSYIKSLLGDSVNNQLPYNGNFYQQIQARHDPSRSFIGKSSLENTAQVDPFSRSYEENTYAGYADRVKQLLADVSSGPTATRGGTAATGFMQAEALDQASRNREQEIRANRGIDFGMQSSATNALQGIYQQDSSQGIQAGNNWNSFVQGMYPIKNSAAELDNQRQSIFNQFLPAAYQLLTPNVATQTENLTGHGSQTAGTVAAGFNLCCFIFLEAYHGKMPWFVRECRDEFAPESSARRDGYRKMANWLVPAMRKYRLVRWITWLLMIKPITLWGGYYKKAQGYENGWLFKPAVKFWFKVWEKMGKEKTNNG